MEAVWKDFPKQKLDGGSSSSSHHHHFLLNYLGLSKNPRYRQFFYIANILLRKHIMVKCFHGLRRVSEAVKRFKERQRDQKLNLCFQFLRRQAEKQVLLRIIMTQRAALRNGRAIKASFQALNWHARLQRRYYQMLKVRKEGLIERSFNTWLSKSEKIKRLKVHDEASTQIYRQRYLSKYLSIWLKELHMALKAKSLEGFR